MATLLFAAGRFIRGVIGLVLVWVLFAWPWYLDLPVLGKAVIIAIWYFWNLISFFSWLPIANRGKRSRIHPKQRQGRQTSAKSPAVSLE